MLIHIPAAVGELVDKITILEIKQKNVEDTTKQGLITTELDHLKQCLNQHVVENDALRDARSKLKEINQTLWNIEDDIRQCERQKCFDTTFIELARKVYFTNDQRAAIKQQINELTGSTISEVKSYEDY
jgi:hypothetical protein